MHEEQIKERLIDVVMSHTQCSKNNVIRNYSFHMVSFTDYTFLKKQIKGDGKNLPALVQNAYRYPYIVYMDIDFKFYFACMPRDHISYSKWEEGKLSIDDNYLLNNL